MNELKPEDVMRALDILDKMDFFQGQRAGRELWREKPFEVQEQDIADFSNGIDFIKKVIMNASLLLTDAKLEALQKELTERKLMAEMHRFTVEEIRAEAIDEFADALEKHFCHDPAFLGVEQRLIMDVVKQKSKELKGEENGESDT